MNEKKEINFKINKIEKCGSHLTLHGFDDIDENQTITIKLFGNEDHCTLVLVPKEEEPRANRITACLQGKELMDPIIVELISQYLPKDETAFIHSDDAYILFSLQ